METTKEALRRLKVRDKVKFQVTTRESDKPAVRMVKTAKMRPIGSNYVKVEFFGTPDFRVQPHEILEIYPRVVATESRPDLGIKEGKDYWIESMDGDEVKLLGVTKLVPASLVPLPN